MLIIIEISFSVSLQSFKAKFPLNYFSNTKKLIELFTRQL